MLRSQVKHLSTFSGIGGFDLASKMNGFENIAQIEINPYCREVLKKNYPSVERYSDIKDFNGYKYENGIDIISGGFPCQPFSIAGQKRGKEDERYLWGELIRVIREIKPTVFIGENVTGIIKLALNDVLLDLENEGYTTETYIIPACAKNAPHRRDRVWIVAYRENKRWHRGSSERRNIQEKNGRWIAIAPKRYGEEYEIASYTDGKRGKEGREYRRYGKSSNNIFHNGRGKKTGISKNWLEVASQFCRVDDGVSKELHKPKRANRLARLESLGNAIVPQIAYEIFQAIYENILSKT